MQQSSLYLKYHNSVITGLFLITLFLTSTTTLAQTTRLCDPLYWQSYRQGESQAGILLRAEDLSDLNFNHDCGEGNRPLHIALQDPLAPVDFLPIKMLMRKGKVNLTLKNKSGQTILDLVEIRFDRQLRGNFVDLLRRTCHGQITRREYNRQYTQIYDHEISFYMSIKVFMFEEDDFTVTDYFTIRNQIEVDLYGRPNLPRRLLWWWAKWWLCTNYR